ncbi:hypothetical protein P9112_002054 [Eukaryota sp. TZLM1-RC]
MSSAFSLQRQIRESVELLQQEMLELRDWEKDMQVQDKKLATKAHKPSNVPPIRGTKAFESSLVQEESRSSSPETVVNKPPEEQAEELKHRGNKHFVSNDLFSAITCYTEALELSPSAPIYSNRAFCHLKLGNFEQTVADASSAISCDSSFYKAYIRRGLALKRLGKLEEALCDFDLGLKHSTPKVHREINKERGDVIRLIESKKSREVKQEVNSIGSVEEIDECTVSAELKNQSNKEKEQQEGQVEKEEKFPTPVNSTSISDSKEIIDKQKNDLIIPKAQLPSPKTASDLEFGLRELNGRVDLIIPYLQSINVTDLPTILRTGLGADLYEKIINNLTLFDDVPFVVSFLWNLSKVPRFSFVNLFLKNKQILKDLFEKIHGCEGFFDLKKLYKI